MKKFLMLACASLSLMALASCSNDDSTTIEGTACQITNNAVKSDAATAEINGTIYEAKIIYYTDATELSEQFVGQVAGNGGKSNVFAVPEGANNARLALMLAPITITHPDNVMLYTATFSLTPDVATNITIDNSTMLTITKSGDTISLGELLNLL
ncbi:MAG: hypothetical protein RR132_00715 [Rikenellaceae bacterium]